MTSTTEDGAVMKLESADGELCALCGLGAEEGALQLPEEHDQQAPPHLPPLRSMLLHLNHSKLLPEGRLCGGCAARAVDAYEFSQRLGARAAPPLSDKIRALRRRLHELTQKIDVFIVVGGSAGGGGAGGAGPYSEEDIIMVEREALAAAAAADHDELERAHNARGDTVFQCSVCPMSFQRGTEFREHIATHPADSVHSCWTCGEQCGTRAHLKEHQMTHDVAQKVCNLCQSTFQSESEMVRHAATCAAVPAACPACGARALGRAALAAHAAAAHAALCPVCFACLGSAEALAAHALQHRQAAARHFVCGYDGCILRFASRAALLAHIRKCHAQPAAPAPPPAPAAAPAAAAAAPGLVDCRYCDRKFASAAAMKRHLRVHRSDVELEMIEHDEMLGEAIQYLRSRGEGAPAGEGEGMEAEEVEYLEMESLEEEALDVKPHIA